MPLQNLYLVGGQQKKLGHLQPQEWRVYKKGLIAEFNLSNASSKLLVDYVSPAEVCWDGDHSITFKAATFQDDKCYVCTETEILIYMLPSFKKINYISLPCFNDLHHVSPTLGGNLLVAVTGLDTVLELSETGDILREWHVLGGNTWEHFSKEIDYRKVPTTKPHQSHPNFVFQVDGDIWVTRFEQRDAICLTRPSRRIAIDVERVHDGIVVGNKVYFTAVNGHIAIANMQTDQIERLVDLNRINRSDPRPLGWCRGLHVVDEDHVIVGFSRMRPTKFRENVQWVKNRLPQSQTMSGNMPTRIAMYDLQRNELCWEHMVEDIGLNVIFSVHPVGCDRAIPASLSNSY